MFTMFLVKFTIKTYVRSTPTLVINNNNYTYSLIIIIVDCNSDTVNAIYVIIAT